MERRLDEAEVRHDDLEQYTRKFNLVIHGISEKVDEDNAENVIELGKLLNVNLTRSDIDIVHRMNVKSNPDPSSSALQITTQRVNYTKPDCILEVLLRKILDRARFISTRI